MWFDVAQQDNSPNNNKKQPQASDSAPFSVSTEFLPRLYAQSYTGTIHPLITSFLFPLPSVAPVPILWRLLLTGFCLRLSDFYSDSVSFVTFKHCDWIDWPVFRIEHHWIDFSSNACDSLLAFLMSGLERAAFESSINSQWSQLWTKL